jgi:cysteate synthase
VTGAFWQSTRRAIEQVCADVLANRRPPYSVRGGLRDVLTESAGEVMVAENPAVRAAMAAFQELHSIDIEPAAGVALACLRDAVSTGRIARDDAVLLNVTGGGRARLAAEHRLHQPEPDARYRFEQVAPDDVVGDIVGRFDLPGRASLPAARR